VGEIDVAVVPDVERMAVDSLADCPDNAPTVVIDVTDVTFLDSSGLGVLIALQNMALERGREAVLRGPSRRIWRLLEITGLAGIFTVG
jgi:anti-sigma B factor antagonist